MNRREIIAGLGSAAAWPLVARAQQSDRMRRVGVLVAYDETDPEAKARLSAFTQRLTEFGWIDGRNVRIDYRWPAGLARNNLPAVYSLSVFARDGGLLSYGPDIRDNFRRAASYVDRILRGAKPEDLPVQVPIKFEMAVNLTTAKALGLMVPQSILQRADEVIE